MTTFFMFYAATVMVIRFMKSLHMTINATKPIENNSVVDPFAVLPVSVIRTVSAAFTILNGITVLVLVNYVWNSII